MNHSLNAAFDRINRCEEALKRQQKKTRLLLVAFFGLLVVAAFGFAGGDMQFDTVTAHKIVVLDKHDRPRINLEAPEAGAPDGDVNVILRDEKGQAILSLRQAADSAIIYLQRFAGDSPSVFLSTNKVAAEMDVSGGAGNPPIAITATKQGPGIVVRDPTAKAKVEIQVDNKKNPRIEVQGADETTKFLVAP